MSIHNLKFYSSLCVKYKNPNQYRNDRLEELKRDFLISPTPEEYKKLTSLVSLASLMVDYYDKKIDFYQIDEFLLEIFHIASKEQFDKIVQRLGQSMQKGKK